MSNEFVNNVMVKLIGKISDDDLKLVKQYMEMESSNYDISPKCTEVSTYYEHYPECVKIYLATRLIEGLSKNSVKLYELTLRLFFEYMHRPIETITANDIRVYLYTYKEQRKVSNRTLDTTRTIIATFFVWAFNEGYIETNPCKNIKAIKFESKPRQSLTEMELEQIRSACETEREKAIIETFYSTGCRVSELINIKKSDINFAEHTIIVTGKGNKTRTVYINAKAELTLKKYLFTRNDDCPYLFVSVRKPCHNLTKEAVEREVKKIGVRANLERPLFCHLIRHTTATLGLKHGMDVTQVQKMLGHVNISTTMIYAEVNDDGVKESALKSIV